MRVMKPIINYFKQTDKLYWLIMLSISAYSLLLLKPIPPSSSGRSYFTVQLIAIVIGYCGAIFLTLIDYREIANYWYLVAGFCLFLIVYTHIFGVAVTSSGGINAKAWIKLPGGTFQPSELVKIGFMITFSKHLSELKKRELLESFPQVILLACHAMVPILLVHFQGDDGTAVIFFCMFLSMTFGAGVQLRYFAAVFAAIAIGFPIAWQYILKDYQKMRLTSFLHPENDPLKDGYQQYRGMLSIGSGQFWGRGLFNSDTRVSKKSCSGTGKRLYFFCSRRIARICWLYADSSSSDSSPFPYSANCEEIAGLPWKFYLLRLFRDGCGTGIVQSGDVP